MITVILLIAAIVCFLLDAFKVQAAVNWVSLGYAFVTGAVLARVTGY